jgi:hypothetical protein
MQHLRLVSTQAGLPTLVVGHANHIEGKAELRSFEYVDAVHRQRYGRPLVLDRAAYDAFMDLAKVVLGALNLRATVAGPPADLSVEPDAPSAQVQSRRRVTIMAVTVLALFVFCAAMAWMLLFRRR